MTKTVNDLPHRVVKRAPISVANIHAADLGKLLEVETDTHQIRWPKGKVTLYGDPKTHAAIGLEGGTRGSKTASNGEIDPRVADLFERWTGRRVRNARTDTAKFAGKPKWVSFGRINRVDYWSDKKGRKTEYTHDTDSVLYRFGGAKPPWIWVIRGMKITSRGFVG